MFLWHVILEPLIFIFHSYCCWVVYAEHVLKTKSTLYKQEVSKLWKHFLEKSKECSSYVHHNWLQLYCSRAIVIKKCTPLAQKQTHQSIDWNQEWKYKYMQSQSTQCWKHATNACWRNDGFFTKLCLKKIIRKKGREKKLDSPMMIWIRMPVIGLYIWIIDLQLFKLLGSNEIMVLLKDVSHKVWTLRFQDCFFTSVSLLGSWLCLKMWPLNYCSNSMLPPWWICTLTIWNSKLHINSFL